MVRDKHNSAKGLEAFAVRIEEMLAKGRGGDSMERLICRLLTGEDLKVAASLASKWVEWRYGKPTERVEHSGSAEWGIGATPLEATNGNGNRVN